MWKPKIIGAGFIFALAFSLCAEAKLCKWVDDNGDIHYGDVIPSEYATQDTDQANKSEVRGKCNEKMIRTKEEEAANIAAKKETEEKKRRANALRNTYSSEKEIDMALERNSALINARIESYNIQLKSPQSTLDDLKKEFENRRKEGRKIPQSLYDDISLTEARVTRLQLERAKSEEELKSMKARYEDDKIVYRKIILLNPVKDSADSAENCVCPYPDSDETSDYSDDASDYPRHRAASKRARRSRVHY